ncbi:vitamin K-dependent protein S [Rhinichthys klamathensis goyatoka]|uniref:vitamin K-dependent protein S n=1 Tax=Rhinichthys klamathensis goyatoka TaxID=3034132 RepID=UPI0024B4B421|nr:vitamin K-dependent protein S [Rhinichthys klamathensis goyatoka]
MRILIGLAFLLLRAQLSESHRFLAARQASEFLRRHRRANTLFEESKKGNLERECVEELCNKEEAREIFENNLETEYFYPKYVVCLGSHRVGINNPNSERPRIPQDLRTCVQEISNQCLPLPCYKEGYERCVDGQGKYTCVCKPGWRGQNCDQDINECEDPEFPAGCSQTCHNLPGSFSCSCEKGFYTHDNIHCNDINECVLYPSVCVEPSQCINAPGTFECRCPLGYRYNTTLRECVDVDECEQEACEGECVNSAGSFSCHCDGRKGVKLARDGRVCEEIPQCLDLYDHKHEEMLYLGEQFSGVPVIYLRFRLQADARFAAEFDFRTFDPEGVILYAESSPDSWLMLGLRSGRIEVQFKNQHSVKMTSGGKAINDGQWHVISVEELMGSVSVKISKEAVMSINSPERLFTPVNDKLETKLYIAGLPNRNESLIKPINPRLDACIRGWDLMNQGASGVKEVIQEKESKHCYVFVEKGSFFSGGGLALFNIDYNGSDQWTVDVVMSIRPSSSTGVLFALVTNNTVPLSVAVVTRGPVDADLQVFVDGVCVATLQSLMLCYPDRLLVELRVSADVLLLSANSSSVTYSDPVTLSEALAKLDRAMQRHVHTYIGGLPDLPVSITPISAFFHGCLEISVNGRQLDFDEAVSKDNSIKSHSCPPVSAPDTPQ